ncbi:hypothetical protein A2U01_0013627, partial [Trifolium medium]|nr:hypothetical protein [Trifolium medium]
RSRCNHGGEVRNSGYSPHTWWDSVIWSSGRPSWPRSNCRMELCFVNVAPPRQHDTVRCEASRSFPLLQSETRRHGPNPCLRQPPSSPPLFAGSPVSQPLCFCFCFCFCLPVSPPQFLFLPVLQWLS